MATASIASSLREEEEEQEKCPEEKKREKDSKSTRQPLVQFRMGSLTNDVYLSTIHILEQAVQIKRKKKKHSRPETKEMMGDDGKGDGTNSYDPMYNACSSESSQQDFSKTENTVIEYSTGAAAKASPDAEHNAGGGEDYHELSFPPKKCRSDSEEENWNDKRGIKIPVAAHNCLGNEEKSSDDDDDKEDAGCYARCLQTLAFIVSGKATERQREKRENNACALSSVNCQHGPDAQALSAWPLKEVEITPARETKQTEEDEGATSPDCFFTRSESLAFCQEEEEGNRRRQGEISGNVERRKALSQGGCSILPVRSLKLEDGSGVAKENCQLGSGGGGEDETDSSNVGSSSSEGEEKLYGRVRDIHSAATEKAAAEKSSNSDRGRSVLESAEDGSGSEEVSSLCADDSLETDDNVTSNANVLRKEQLSAQVDDQLSNAPADQAEEEEDIDVSEAECDMNYFRSRFQRQQTQFNTESVLRDCSRRRRRTESQSRGEERSLVEQQSSFGKAMSSVTANARASRVRQRPEAQLMSLQDEACCPTKILSPITRRRRQRPTTVDGRDRTAAATEETATVGLKKTSSLRRRRCPSNDGQSGDGNPLKKGNFTVEVEEKKNADYVPQQKVAQDCISSGKDEEDPLKFIEIKSAAQWKAMSNRISWKFDEGSEAAKQDETPTVNFSLKSEAGQNQTEGFKPTTVQQLRLVCWKTKPWNQPKRNPRLYSSQFAAAWGVDCDEVHPGLFIGDKETASNLAFLKKLGITHILNTAEGKDEGLVDLSQDYYQGTNIKYLGFPLWDTPTCNIIPYLGCAAEFIGKAIEGGGKCLVNCQMGVSRSSSCAISHLLINKEMTATQALTQCRLHRDVRPNDGFLEQLADLDNDLRRAREHGQERKLKLSSLSDLNYLPQPWNYEFWTKPVTEEEIEMPLVKLGEPCPLPTSPKGTSSSSRLSSKLPSRLASRRSSKKSSRASRRSSNKSSRSLSRHSSFKSVALSRSSKGDGGQASDNEDDDGEWEWYEDEDDDEENVDPAKPTPEPTTTLTTEKLRKVKDIIEKPEDRWRILWQKDRCCDSPSSIASSLRSISSNLSSSNSKSSNNIVQPGVEGGDPLSLVKVVSAKQWKTISQKLSINLDGIDLNEENQSVSAPGKSTPLDFKPTTAQQLTLICWRIKPWDQPKARHLFTSLLGSGWGVDCDEVYPNIFIGDEATARNIKFLHKMKISHVLNAAEGIWTDHSFVDLTSSYYKGSGITYQGFQLWDSDKVGILPFFGCANEFISAALKRGGKCLINCQMGVSRSCALAMAYMMLSEGWEALDVMREFRKRRDVRPNDRFLAQLAQLDNELRKERLFKTPRQLKLHSLADLPGLPKPWHHEFWDVPPDPEDLPFTLCHMNEKGSGEHRQREVVQQDVVMRERSRSPVAISKPAEGLAIPSTGRETRLSVAASSTGSGSDYEWEYYSETETEDTEQPEEAKSVRSTLISADCEVGSAKEWREISCKLCSGDLAVQVDAPDPGIVATQEKAEEKKEFEPTTEKQLRLICWQVKPWSDRKPSRLFSSQFAIPWKVDCDEVFPNLFIGDASTAKNIKFLKHLKITHVLNTAEGKEEGLVNIDKQYFEGSNLDYLGFLMWDSTWFDIAPFIAEAVNFIEDALETGGKCLVNCQMGVSRSSTCAMAYLMKKKNFTACEALRQFRSNRDVRPNDGFIKYLVSLDNQLRRKREG